MLRREEVDVDRRLNSAFLLGDLATFARWRALLGSMAVEVKQEVMSRVPGQSHPNVSPTCEIDASRGKT